MCMRDVTVPTVYARDGDPTIMWSDQRDFVSFVSSHSIDEIKVSVASEFFSLLSLQRHGAQIPEWWRSSVINISCRFNRRLPWCPQKLFDTECPLKLRQQIRMILIWHAMFTLRCIYTRINRSNIYRWLSGLIYGHFFIATLVPEIPQTSNTISMA